MSESTNKILGLSELKQNQQAFEKRRETLEREHTGKFALFSSGKFKQVLEDEEEA